MEVTSNYPAPEESATRDEQGQERIISRVLLKLKKAVRTRVVMGILVLLVVDFIWVAAAVISEVSSQHGSWVNGARTIDTPTAPYAHATMLGFSTSTLKQC